MHLYTFLSLNLCLLRRKDRFDIFSLYTPCLPQIRRSVRSGGFLIEYTKCVFLGDPTDKRIQRSEQWAGEREDHTHSPYQQGQVLFLLLVSIYLCNGVFRTPRRVLCKTLGKDRVEIISQMPIRSSTLSP